MPLTRMNHLLARVDGVLCTVCGCTEPIHPGHGTPLSTLLHAYLGLVDRHPLRKHEDPFKDCKRGVRQ